MPEDQPINADRRAFLRRVAAGTAVAGSVWVAPSILKVSAAGAATGSCMRSTLSWADSSVGNTGGTVDSVTVTIATSASGTNSGIATMGISNSSSGNFNPHYRLSWPGSGGATGDTITMTMTFSPVVNDLCFTLTDLDAAGGGSGWRDTVTVSATGPGTPTVSSTTQGSHVLGSNPWNGDQTKNNASSTGTDGNVEVLVSGAVETVTISYAAGPESGASQHIGVIDPNWCMV